MASLAKPPDRGGGDGERQANEPGIQGVPSYANKVAGKQGRKQLNVLDIMLERKDSQVSYNLTKEELAKLLFSKMKLDPKSILKLDTSGFGKINVELAPHLDPEMLVNLPAFDIRDGLRVKYYKPHYRKYVLVTISWLDIETPDELLLYMLNYFGKVKSNVKWTKVKEEEGESQLAKMLNSILSGERQVWMEVKTPLPSYAMIDNRKVKIHHVGQRRTCARCQKVAGPNQCPGNANARLCEENGGDKIKVADVWKDILISVNYKDWNGGQPEKAENEEENEDLTDPDDERSVDISNCDGFVLSNLEEDTTIEDIKTIMKGSVPDEVLEVITVHPTGSTRSKIIKDVDPSLVNTITRNVDKKSFKGRLLHCRPHVPITPPKAEAHDANGERKDSIEEIESEDKSTASAVPDTPAAPAIEKLDAKKEASVVQKTSGIPGLLQEDIDKAKKTVKNKKQKNVRKEKKEHSSQEQTSSLTPDAKLNQEFDFSHCSVDDEAFEDSIEAQTDDPNNLLNTPKPFKSSFANYLETKLATPVSTPTTSRPKRDSDLAGLSPIEAAGNKKNKSLKPPGRTSALPLRK